MALIDETYSDLDKTVRLFDSFYDFDMVVNSNQYDLVYSYFFSVSNSKIIARNFTTFIFRISSIIGEDALVLLGYIKGKDSLQTNALMAYYLNGIKSKTTLYGVSMAPKPNQTVQRNIVV
jgi:hypothetical protein